MAAVPRELWLAHSQGDVSDSVAVMVVSVPGRRRQRSHFPQLSISLPVQEDAGTHLNFAPPPPFAAAWAKFRCAPASSCVPKAQGASQSAEALQGAAVAVQTLS